MTESNVSLKLEEFREDFPLLVEAGFVATKQLDEVGAKRLFCGAQILNRFHSAPQVGLGYIALNKLEIKEAIGYFRYVLNSEPENFLAQAFLGICYGLSKNKKKKGEKLLRDSMAKTEDPTIKNLCIVSLEWMDKELPRNKTFEFVDLPEEL